jgi:hypothetical protein
MTIKAVFRGFLRLFAFAESPCTEEYIPEAVTEVLVGVGRCFW